MPAPDDAPRMSAPLARAWSSTVYGDRHHRRQWRGERLHIEVRGLAPEPACDPTLSRRVAGAVEQEVNALTGVRWAAANAPVGRIIVDIADPCDPADVVAAVERAEHACGAAAVGFPHTSHAADTAPLWQALTALAVDAAGLGVGAVGLASRARGLPHELSVVTSLLAGQPHLRALATHLLGPAVGDIGLAAVNAVANGLAYGPIGVTADLAWRAVSLSETASRRRRWAVEEPQLCGHPRAAAARPIAVRPRPAPLPDGPVERYTRRATAIGAVGAVGTAVITRSPARAAFGMYALLPTAARLGRDTFAAQLSRVLSDAGSVVLDREALQRLDRVDTVVIELPQRRNRRTTPRWADALVAAARRAGLMVVEATAHDAPGKLPADLRVMGGSALADEVRSLQADGCGVLLVTGADPSSADALWAADVAVGLWRGTGAVAWAADVLIAPEHAWRLADAAARARSTAAQSVAICTAGAAAASAVVLATPSPRRASWAVNGAALVAIANATRAVSSLGRDAPREADAPPPPWHTMPAGDVLDAVGSGPAGLSDADAAQRVAPELRPVPAPVRLAAAVGNELVNPLTPILLGGAGLSAALGGALDAAVVAGVTAVNAVMGGVQRWRTDMAADALAQVGDYTVHVRRNGGSARAVHAEDVVVGDVLVLRAGDVVPADARVLTVDAALVDESTLTGESLPVEKSPAPSGDVAVAERRSMLYAGTSLLAGDATAVVVATGADTESGRAAVGVRATTGGVDARLADLTRKALPVSLGAGGAVLAIGALRGRPLAEGLRNGATLAVAAVPEGLPIVATMAQLASARRLATRGVLVRNHRAIEALGRVDVLLTDKTGTLTMGRLDVKVVSDLDSDADIDALAPTHRDVLAAAIRATPRPEDGRRMAHPTDGAVIRGGENVGVDEQTGIAGWRRAEELPFRPALGFHATLGRATRRSVVSVKGAPEVVIPRCRDRRRGGRSSPLSPDDVARVEADVERLARRGLRILAVAEGPSGSPLCDDSVQGLTLLGLVAIADRVRPEASSAVRTIQEAGVSVCMVTGDHPSTAEGIAAELGILNGHRVVSGSEVESLDDDALDAVVERVSVFARVTPADKVRIVKSLRRRGRIVAMTGDGSNDAPAIRLADVGVAVGTRATPAARQAADVIVTDDDIETIIDAVIEGRSLWGAVRDALAILLGGNLGEVAFNVIGAGLGGSTPLNPRQLLLVNLLTDVAPAVAIATRPPRAQSPTDLLAEGPDRSLGAALDRAILTRAAVTTGGTTVSWLLARATGRRQRASTVALASLVGTQLAQTVTNGGTNRVVVGSALGSAAALVLFIQTPGLSQVCGCTPLGPVAWSQVAVGTGAAFAASLLLNARAMSQFGTSVTSVPAVHSLVPSGGLADRDHLDAGGPKLVGGPL